MSVGMDFRFIYGILLKLFFVAFSDTLKHDIFSNDRLVVLKIMFL